MAYSILTEARVQASVADLQPASRSYSVFWSDNFNLQGWESIFDLDIVGAWGGFLFGTKSTAATGSIGPVSDIPPVDALVNDKIFFRMKYDKHPNNSAPTSLGKIQWVTTADPVYDASKSLEYEIFTDGTWHFYEIDMGQAINWVGLINNIRFFPCIDGARNDEFFMSFFEIGTLEFDFSFENEKAGRAGKVFGGNSVAASIAIEQGVNDKLIVNLDGYGDVRITLTSQVAIPAIIARDVSMQLGKVSVGGYPRAQCLFQNDTQRFFIQSGTLATDSSAVVIYGDQSAAPVLGFTDTVGNDISTSVAGVDGDENYVPVSAYRLTTLEIFSLFDNDNSLPSFSLDPQVPVIQGGRADYGLTQRRLSRTIVLEGRNTDLTTTTVSTSDSLSGVSVTFIDLNHPFTDDGKLSIIAFNGVADTGGGTKWKIFRPKLDGSLTLVDEGVIGQTTIIEDPDGGLVLSKEPGAFSVDVSAQNVRVRRGDLLGLFNAAFNIDPIGVSKPNAMYYEVSGDAQGTFFPAPPAGAGELGLPIYARGSQTKNRAVVDIDFQKRLNIDLLEVSGAEELRDLEYNLAAASSAGFNIDASGEHTICHQLSPISEIRSCFNRDNQGFNVQALNDGVILAENGISSFGSGGPAGVGGADVAGSTYFYMNGDAEQLGSLEFQNLSPESYGFQRDPLGIDLLFSQSTPRLDKLVGKVVIYFKDKQNMRAWQIETSLGTNSKGGNGSKPGFQLVPETSISRVRIDNKDVENVGFYISTKPKDTISTLLLSNPSFMDVVAGDGTRNPQQGVDFQDSVAEIGGANLEEQLTFLEFQWNRFEWNFTGIRTEGFRWYSDFHWSTKITEFQVFAVSSNSESLGDNIQPLFSPDGVAFTSGRLRSASTSSANFKLGGSPQFMRLIFRPTLKLDINDLKFKFEEDQVSFGDEGRLRSDMSVNEARVGDIPGEATPLKITNLTGETADLILDIPSDINTSRQLLYFSKLSSEADVTRPQVGPPGRVDFKSDKILTENENIANNAVVYGLRSLVSGTSNIFLEDNILLNSDFENGTLENTWDLNITSSGSAVDSFGIGYQVPRVLDLNASSTGEPNPDEDSAVDFQSGNYCFGVSESTKQPGHADFNGVIDFEFSQTVDVSRFSSEIDAGGAVIGAAFSYIYYNVDGGEAIARMYGSPTTSGIDAAPNTIIGGYGNNLLRSVGLAADPIVLSTEKTNTYSDVTVTLPVGTRHVKLEFDVRLGDGPLCFSPETPPCHKKFLLDSTSLSFQITAASSSKWYKHWRGGEGNSNSLQGWTSASFKEVDSADFTDTAGSHHWWEPFDADNTSGTPNGGSLMQTQGFSEVFNQLRDQSAQSFSRMRVTDPGFLGAQWEVERSIVGLRIGLWHNPSGTSFFAKTFPRYLQLEVLKTKAELLGVAPDIQNTSHFKVVKVHRDLTPVSPPAELSNSSGDSTPRTRLLTFLFDEEPIVTQGIKIVFTLNCDRFERQEYADNVAFAAATGCPPDNVFGSFDWTSDFGLTATYFTPLEDVGNSSLPLDNVVAAFETGNTYAAVDLGRLHDIELDSDLFELIADTRTHSQWNVTGVKYSATRTDDPNLVEWTGGSSNARWIRFESPSESEYERTEWVLNRSSINQVLDPFTVDQVTQSVLNQARIYPSLQTTLIPTIGYNSGWDNLGTVLTDGRNDSFLYASDYPVFSLDLGKSYIISNDPDLVRKRHDLVAPGAPGLGAQDDINYWEPDSEVNFSYASNLSGNTSRPETVSFGAWNGGVPETPVRWVAFKAQAPLQAAGIDSSLPKRYNFSTQGQVIFGVTYRPLLGEPFTENARWFNSKKSVLRDISTFAASAGATFSYQDGLDYGSSAGFTGDSTETTANNRGSPAFAFDGVFDEFVGDVWGVQVRDVVTGLEEVSNSFPHSIWRVFLDPFRGDEQIKEVKAIRVTGYNEQFHPTDLRFQSLEENSDGSAKDPNLDTSWSNIDDASFTGLNTFQEGVGFLHIFTTPVTTKGIRVRIIASEYPDDSVMTETNELNQINAAQPDISGPETRVQSVTIYEEVFEESVLEGELVVNHALSADSVTSLTNTPGREAANLIDGDLRSFWESTGFDDRLTITLPEVKTIDRVEWEKDQALDELSGGVGQGAPQNFTITAVVDGIERTLLEEEDFFGITYSGTLSGGPIASDTWIMDISRVQQQENSAASIQISELRLLEVTEQSTPLVTVTSTSERRPGSLNSSAVKLTYSADTQVVAKIFAAGLDADNDAEFSERDFFSVWLHINDISLMDTSVGALRLGNDSDTFYRWDFKDMPLQTGWNELKLQFSQAADKSPIAFLSGFQFNPAAGNSAVDFITPDVRVTTFADGTFSSRVAQSPGIRYFDIEIKGVGGSRSLELILDDMRFVRNKFEDVCKFSSSLYLNSNETFVIHQEGLDLSTGTVEFWFQPDWDTGGRVQSSRSIVPAIFRIMRPDGKYLAFFYRPNQGFIGLVYDAARLWQFVIPISTYRFEPYDTFHVAVSWDHRALIAPFNTSFEVRIDNRLVYGTDKQWDALRQSGSSVVFGGEMGQKFAAAPLNDTALTFTPVPGIPIKNTASSWALIENLKMYNYAKTDFSDRLSADLDRTQLLNPSEMIEISLDNINFEAVGSDQLPLVVRAVPDSSSVTTYVRTILPRDLTGEESRDASLLVRWKTPLRTCD